SEELGRFRKHSRQAVRPEQASSDNGIRRGAADLYQPHRAKWNGAPQEREAGPGHQYDRLGERQKSEAGMAHRLRQSAKKGIRVSCKTADRNLGDCSVFAQWLRADTGRHAHSAGTETADVPAWNPAIRSEETRVQNGSAGLHVRHDEEGQFEHGSSVRHYAETGGEG